MGCHTFQDHNIVVRLFRLQKLESVCMTLNLRCFRAQKQPLQSTIVSPLNCCREISPTTVSCARRSKKPAGPRPACIGQTSFVGGNRSAHTMSTLVQTFVIVASLEFAQLQICLGGHYTDQRGGLPLRATGGSQENRHFTGKQ